MDPSNPVPGDIPEEAVLRFFDYIPEMTTADIREIFYREEPGWTPRIKSRVRARWLTVANMRLRSMEKRGLVYQSGTKQSAIRPNKHFNVFRRNEEMYSNRAQIYEFVRNNGGKTSLEIAEGCGSKTQTVRLYLCDFCKNGHVYYQNHPTDGRSKVFYATDPKVPYPTTRDRDSSREEVLRVITETGGISEAEISRRLWMDIHMVKNIIRTLSCENVIIARKENDEFLWAMKE